MISPESEKQIREIAQEEANKQFGCLWLAAVVVLLIIVIFIEPGFRYWRHEVDRKLEALSQHENDETQDR